MMVYLSSPGNQMHADYLAGMPVLLSFATWSNWLKDYQASFGRILIDSGAFSEMNSGIAIDGAEYRDWWQQWQPHADGIAGLDDIRGDWRKSLRNYEAFGGFPTIHDSDPPELLKDLIPIARKQGKRWLGIGLVPPRAGKEDFVRWVCDNVPDDLRIHGWALRAFTNVRRLDSVDSTNWFRDAWTYKNKLPFLTPAECVELVVKRYQRWQRKIEDVEFSKELSLFDG
jgi:hypothetical protein